MLEVYVYVNEQVEDSYDEVFDLKNEDVMNVVFDVRQLEIDVEVVVLICVLVG